MRRRDDGEQRFLAVLAGDDGDDGEGQWAESRNAARDAGRCDLADALQQRQAVGVGIEGRDRRRERSRDGEREQRKGDFMRNESAEMTKLSRDGFIMARESGRVPRANIRSTAGFFPTYAQRPLS